MIGNAADGLGDRKRADVTENPTTILPAPGGLKRAVGGLLLAAPCLLLVSAAAAVRADTPAAAEEAAAAAVDAADPQSTDEKIRRLIEELGSDSYATRVRARNQLKRYGLEAFDALREAQNHSDSEILSAARYLISSLHVSWSKETDPPEVREILFEYGAQTESDRLGRIEMLGRLPDDVGLIPLARLARFEPSISLSRHAAMLILKKPIDRDAGNRLVLAGKLKSVLGGSDRDAATWLLAYASDLTEQRFDVGRWMRLIDKQRHIANAGLSKNVSPESVMELIRVLASRAQSENQDQAALDIALENVDLVTPQTSDLAEHCEWAIHLELFPVVTALYQNNLHLFHENAALLYSAAQAFDESDQTPKAASLAAEALTVNPFPESAGNDDESDADDESDEPTERQLEEIGDAHRGVAALLISRGRNEWAEREYRYIIDHCDIETSPGRIARYELARVYAEQLRHQDAVDLLFPIVDRSNKDALFRRQMQAQLQGINSITSLHEFESALIALEEDRLQDAKKLLQSAYRRDRSNIDILIKMYRVEDPDDPQWRSTVRSQIAQNRNAQEKNIAAIEAGAKRRPDARWDASLAIILNQYAWLVANTEGDYGKALEASQRSLELTDDSRSEMRAARLDTCARCYFALDRIDDAIRTQKQALEIMPHSPAMQRQLQEFQAAE